MELNDLKTKPTLVWVNLKIRGPAGLAPNSTLSIQSKVVTKESTNVYNETIGLIPNAVISACAAVGGLQGDTQWIEVTTAGKVNCYWLPWGEGKIYMGQLGPDHEFFFTYTINGCGVIIGGTQAQPVVGHANLACQRLDDAVTDALKLGPAAAGAAAAKAQAIIYDQFYGNLAAKLIQDDRLSGARLEMVTPQQYLVDAKAGFGAVFGVNKGGAWEFYGNWAKQTTKIWP